MDVDSMWDRTKERVTRWVTEFCVARDAHRGTAWERLSVAYPDPAQARRAVELFRVARLQVPAGAAQNAAA